MAVEYKDYYQILGVTRTATDDEIRKAFRRLAREYHPDVAKNKAGAEDRFKEINEAYEVVGDPAKRKKYDELGSSWRSGGGGFPGNGARGGYRTRSGGPGPSFGGTGFSDFFEQFFGSVNRGNARTRTSGPDFGSDEMSSRGQDMEADIMVTLEEVLKGSVRPVSLRRNVACSPCGGQGQVNQKTCPACGGTGNVTRSETYKVRIPAGVKEGARLRLAGQGETGFAGGQAGDLFLNVRYASHPDFRIDNGHLTHELDLAPWEAALGTEVSVPTLDSPVNIRIPAGTQTGSRLRVRERGLSEKEGVRGDLYVSVRIRIPDKLSESEKKLWQQLADESDFDPRN